MALGLCVAAARGGAALGKIEAERGAALYLALKDNVRRLQKRMRKVLGGRKAPASFDITTEFPRIGEGFEEALQEWRGAHPDARLVVVDTLAKIRPATKAGNSVYSEDYAALETLLPIAARHNVAILVVHHLRKMSADDPLDEISGSTGLTGGVDGILVLKRDRGAADA